MTKTLVIAEKPSVAQDIVRALTPVTGKFDKHEDYFENEHYVVTSAVGHLVEIQAPEEFDVKRGKWSFAHLPVIPPRFDLKPVDKTKSRLAAVVKQAKRKDVTQLINACDAGREGELIFRLIEQYAGGAKGGLGKPIQRLWLQSMTPQAIRDGFNKLRSDAADAGPGRCGAQPLRGRLAGRHQRHAGHDGLQLARWRLLSDHRGPGADAHAVARRGPRGKDPRVPSAVTTWRCMPTLPPRPGSTRASGSTPSGRNPTTPRPRPTACGSAADAAGHCQRRAGPARHRHRRDPSPPPRPARCCLT